jgi:predicted DNA-binding transcriptional regulator YafY
MMKLEKFEKQLKLLIRLTQRNRGTVEEISRDLDLSVRSIYRYLDAFRQLGFIIRREGGRYSIDHDSPFFREITNRIHFSTEEALTISQVLNSVESNSPQMRHLREKLSSLYDFHIMAHYGVDDHLARNLSVIYHAIQDERIVVLRDYASTNSKKVSDRIVEPYIFLPENSEVRCYEITSGTNKTFKLARAKTVEAIDLLWSHKEKHRPFFMDLFHFSGEERHTVTLRLGTLATSILLEEYPGAEGQLTLCADGRHDLTTQVCSFKGIGRFVLGLFDDIEVIDSPDFKKYITERARDLTQKIAL